MYPRLRDLREDGNWTQQDMAEQLFCSQQAYCNYELGQRDIPTAVLIRLAQIHHTSVDYLLGLTDERSPYPRRR